MLPAVALLAVAAAPGASAATPTENLDCAVWASVTMDTLADADAQQGFGFVMNWFIGLYEGATGRDIDDAMVQRMANMTDAEFDRIGPICLDRMSAYGERLGRLSERLAAQGN